MQRAYSAVDFSNLLNPEDSPSPSTTTPDSPQYHSSTEDIHEDTDMAAAVSTMSTSALHSVDRPQEMPRPYKCPLCDKAFHRLEHQTRHIRTHTGEKPHHCSYPGCMKKFSRSDELTRHARIHQNPNSRRNIRGQNVLPNTAMVNYAQEHSMLPSQQNSYTQSAPSSTANSPNVSPPHSYSYTSNPYPQQQSSVSYQQPQHPLADINLLATAASQVERESSLMASAPYGHNPSPARHAPTHQHQSHPYPVAPRHAPNSLSAYHLSNTHSQSSTATTSPSLSRSHSPISHHRHHMSPQSTAPSSPSFSHESLSPPLDHTPLATPAHSPRLRPFNLNSTSSSSSSISNMVDHHHSSGIHLPGLRNLSLGAPGISNLPSLLSPMEPAADGSSGLNYGSATNSPYGSYSHERSGPRISEIMSSTEGSQRKLPVPKVAVKDLLMDERR